MADISKSAPKVQGHGRRPSTGAQAPETFIEFDWARHLRNMGEVGGWECTLARVETRRLSQVSFRRELSFPHVSDSISNPKVREFAIDIGGKIRIVWERAPRPFPQEDVLTPGFL